MKVHIGPYKNWIGPYQLADALCFWVKEVEDEYEGALEDKRKKDAVKENFCGSDVCCWCADIKRILNEIDLYGESDVISFFFLWLKA